MTVLTIYLVALFAVPSDMAIPALGAAGTPASLVGLAAFVWWAWSRITLLLRERRVVPTHPVSFWLDAVIMSAIASYATAMLRPIPIIEASPANTALLRLVGAGGVLLLAVDGITRRDRLVTFIRRLSIAGGLFAALGLAQFLSKEPLVNVIRLPGFASGQGGLSSIQTRGTFVRASATAVHPLEYGTVLAMLLPIALNVALTDEGRSVLIRWWPSIAIVLAAALSLSRSALIGVVVGLAFLVPSWSATIRRWAGFAGVVLAGGLYVAVPGLAGTIKGLFLGLSSSSTATSRTGSYALAGEFFHRSPWFGRGMGTFLPQYRIFDNQYLLQLVETGLVGVTALILLFVSAIRSARSAYRAATDRTDRYLAQALASAMLPGAVLFAFFDAFSFPKAIDTVFLTVGLCGAIRSTALSSHAVGA